MGGEARLAHGQRCISSGCEKCAAFWGDWLFTALLLVDHLPHVNKSCMVKYILCGVSPWQLLV